MDASKTSAEEVENVTRFLQQNSNFLENYLMKHTTAPFLQDVSSRMDKTSALNKSHPDKNGVEKETPEGKIKAQNDEKENDRSSITSPISINISQDDKSPEDDPRIQTVSSNLNDFVSRTDGGKKQDDKDDSECQSPPSSVVPRSARKSVTSDLFHQWLQNGSSKLDTTRFLESQGSLSAGGTPFPVSPSGPFGTANLVGKDLEMLEQNDRLMDLILDISNELDINILCHKILLNVGHLTKADRCSLFLARGPREKRYLEAKLFDVDIDTTLDEAMCRANNEEISIPYGVGICGHVAKTKETINLKDAYEDERFNKEIDAQTGYRTHSLVCMPVCNYDGEVIGVAQIINKRGGINNNEFTETDLKVFKRYLTFCGIGIQNAQLFEVSILEYKKNQLLLSLARSLFQEQMSLERLVSTIITEAKELLKCERCTVYLLELKMYDQLDSDLLSAFISGGAADKSGPPNATDSRENMHGMVKSPTSSSLHSTASRKLLMASDGDRQDSISIESQSDSAVGSLSGSLLSTSTKHKMDIDVSSFNFHRAWELQEGSKEIQTHSQTDEVLKKSRRARIAKYVAATAEVLNISNVANWLGEKLEDRDGFIPKTMLSVPIFNGARDVIGVAQLINKKQGTAFVEADIALFEAFAIFCGIGIHNTKMYEGACKLMAKQKVALDCLSYHAAANDDDTNKLATADIPKAVEFKLDSYKFNDTQMSSFLTYKVVIRMFMEFGLVNQFQIPYKVLCRWILSVRKNYRPVKYHNWRHALNVCQTMYTVLRTGKMDRFMDDLEVFGLLVACLCHDLDHRGTNNAFQSKVVSPLAILYSTSTMEHHHFDQCVMILNSAGNNIFQNLSTDDYRKVMKVVEKAILSTDLALYFRKKTVFQEVANTGEIDWQGEEKKDLLCGMLMTACDVSAIAKPWEIQHGLAKKVADEFFDQGDMEKVRLNAQPIAMMDRERKDELPQMQVDFIDHVCRPLYSTLSDSFPWIKPLLDGCLANREKWADLAEKVEMGLTWIDYEEIDKPIEEIAQGTREADDIEFHVETLTNAKELDTQGDGKYFGGSNNLGKPSKKDVVGGIKRSFRTQTTTKNNQLKHGGSFFHRRLSSKSPSRYRKSSQNQLTTTTGEIVVDGVTKPHHGSLHSTTSIPNVTGSDFKAKQPSPLLEHPTSANAIIGGDISFKNIQPKMVVTPAPSSSLHHDSTVSEGSDKEEVGSALNDRRGELV